jgi:ArsR family transcriptional regulator
MNVIKRIQEGMLKDGDVFRLAEFFKVFGDPTRIRIMYILSTKELCVCDIAAILGMTQSAVSHQLKMLRQIKLVKQRRDGKVIYYSLDDDHVCEIINSGIAHINE